MAYWVAPHGGTNGQQSSFTQTGQRLGKQVMEKEAVGV